MNYVWCFKIFVSALFFGESVASNILAILHFKGSSHFNAISPLLDELAKRGHNVTVASFFPKVKPLENYTSVSLEDEHVANKAFFEFKYFEDYPSSTFNNMRLILKLCEEYERLFTLPQFMGLLDQKFDLVIAEYFNSDMFFGFIHRLGAPFILVHTCNCYPWQNSIIGNSNNPSFMPVALSDRRRTMGLYERVANTFDLYGSLMFYEFFFRRPSQRIAEKYLGPLPDLGEIGRNLSLLLVNTHFSIHGPNPAMPNSVQIGGMNLPQAKKLPQDLKKILDNSEGAIYFSMGSVLKGDSLSVEKKNAFIKVFSELKQTVLWKREDKLEVNVPNIVTSAWFPQRDILAHPKVVLFITHCGLLGTNEAIASGVPMIGIPIFGDQHHNAKAIESIGAGLSLEFAKLDEGIIRSAVHKLLNDPSFRENAKKVQQAFLDRPMSPLDTAVYWVEYVIRHKGAHHLRSAARDLTWYQYHNLDVLAIIISILYVLYLVLKVLVRIMFSLLRKMFQRKKQKVQ